MQVYRNSLLKLFLSIALFGGAFLAVIGAIANTASIASAASLQACAVGTPCTVGVGGTVGGGTLSGTTGTPVVNNGTALALTGQDQTIPFIFLSSVNDATGSGAGWHVSAGATAITFGTGGPTSDLFLDSTTPETVNCSANSSCSSPSALTLAAGGSDLVTAPVTLVSAPLSSGLGGYNISTLGNFTMPAGALAGATTGGVISVTISTGP
jgi:hypothetical protein